MLRPYLDKNGTGTNITAKHPRIAFPQTTPMLRYVGPTKIGNAPANIATAVASEGRAKWVRSTIRKIIYRNFNLKQAGFRCFFVLEYG